MEGETRMTVAVVLGFDGQPIRGVTRRKRLENGVMIHACSVCGLVYMRGGDARVCCGEEKNRAGLNNRWTYRKVMKPYRNPTGWLDQDGELRKGTPQTL